MNSGHLIYLFAIPLIPTFFTVVGRGDLERTAMYGVALGMFALAAFLVNRGTHIQRHRSQKRYVKHHTHAMTWLGGLVAALACFGTQLFLANNSFSMACTVALTALVGVYVTYGSVTEHEKVDGALGYSADEIAGELAKAEDKIHFISDIANQLPPGDIEQRLQRIVRKSNNVLSQIQSDPGDLRRARKFLSVFLPGTRDVTRTYWKVFQSGSSRNFDRRFRRVLAKVEDIIELQIDKLKNNEEFELDVQMDVLITQLEHE